MTVFRPSEVSGYSVPMKVNHAKHIKPGDASVIKGGESSKVEGKSFAELLRNAFYDVNSIELRKDAMMNQFITEPNSIDIHELTNAMAKAELTIGFVRTVADKVIGAYRDISNLR